MRREWMMLAGLALACGASTAQLAAPDSDWKEAQVAPPPPLRTDDLIPVEQPGAALRFGVDPQSVSVGADGVVRYVVVATSTSGAVNAMYEGTRCDSAQVKVYARHTPGVGWRMLDDAAWQPLSGTAATRHSLSIARGGLCMGRGTGRNAADVVRDLRSGPDMRFRNEAR